MKLEASAVQCLACPGQPLGQLLIIRDHYAYMAAQDLRLAGGEMELLTARIDPHVGGTGHHVWISGEAQTVYIEQRGRFLAGHRNVHMFERNDIAEILGGPVVRPFLH
jgi:hypothetical protein